MSASTTACLASGDLTRGFFVSGVDFSISFSFASFVFFSFFQLLMLLVA